jgi:hypothetical protein
MYINDNMKLAKLSMPELRDADETTLEPTSKHRHPDAQSPPSYKLNTALAKPISQLPVFANSLLIVGALFAVGSAAHQVPACHCWQ